MSVTTTTVNVSAQRATLAALLAALVNGIDTELVGVDPFVLDGTTYARADLLARIQAILDAIAGVKAARVALSQAVAKQKVALVQGRSLRAGLKRTLQAKYGPSSPALQKFGFTPARTPKTPVAAKAAAKVKAAATRAAHAPAGNEGTPAVQGAPSPAAPTAAPAAPAGSSTPNKA